MISRIKPIIYAFVLALVFSFLSPVVDSAEAKVIWGKIELKQGIIGKVTVLKNTDLYRITNNKLYVVRKAKKGQEFGVYSYKKDFGGLYGLGGGIYVKKSSSIKYETPSKAKLEQLKLVINEGFYTIYNELQSYKETDMLPKRIQIVRNTLYLLYSEKNST